MTRLSGFAALTTFGVLALLPLGARSQPMARIQAVDYTQSLDVSGNVIRAVQDPCTGRYVLVGLDDPAEWVEYSVKLPGDAFLGIISFDVSVRFRGTSNQPYEFRVTIVSLNPNVSTVTVPKAGGGYSCVGWRPSESQLQTEPGLATIRLRNLGSVDVQVESIEIKNTTAVPTASTTWGAVKSLYE